MQPRMYGPLNPAPIFRPNAISDETAKALATILFNYDVSSQEFKGRLYFADQLELDLFSGAWEYGAVRGNVRTLDAEAIADLFLGLLGELRCGWCKTPTKVRCNTCGAVVCRAHSEACLNSPMCEERIGLHCKCSTQIAYCQTCTMECILDAYEGARA